jgi:hypothetical protein
VARVHHLREVTAEAGGASEVEVMAATLYETCEFRISSVPEVI